MTRYVTDYLVHEHQELFLLLNDFQKQLGVLRLAHDRRGATERLIGLGQRISAALHNHVLEEEQILHPALEENLEGIAFTLDRMRHEHDAGKETGKSFHQSLDRLRQGKGDPKAVMQSGQKYIQWLRKHCIDENGRLFPMVERGLKPETQAAVRQALEKLSREASIPVTQGQSVSAHA